MNKKRLTLFLIIFSVLILDQWLKIWVKTNMSLGQELYPLGRGWFRIHFTENEGMAFGLILKGPYGKLILSIFRLIAVSVMAYYINKLLKMKASFGLICCLSLILAGALGNILDSAFYGLFFSQSGVHSPAVMFPEGGGYAPFLYGHVVDMLYFPVYEGVPADWIPYFGGKYTVFFRPVFNLADMAIFCGVMTIIFFQGRFFSSLFEDKKLVENQEALALETSIDPLSDIPESE